MSQDDVGGHHHLDGTDRAHLQHRTPRRQLFPALAQPTGDLGQSTVPETPAHLGAMMPTRRQTREQDRRDRIAKERRERTELIAEERRKRQAWLAANYEPPPF